jgi:hypothetical protein
MSLSSLIPILMINNTEIEQISETEFTIGENKLSLIEGNIIFVIAQGEQTTEGESGI